MKKTFAVVCMLVLLAVLFAGCNDETSTENEIDIDENIKGQWIATQGEATYGFTFYNDGTCKFSFSMFIMGNYYIVGDRLEFHHPKEEYVGAFQNFYDIEMPDKDTLILTTTRDDMFAHEGRLEFSRVE
jgi:hypothetical protein